MLEDKVGSQAQAMRDCSWLQNHISISLSTETVLSDVQPGFSRETDAAPHLHAASTASC